MMTEITNTPFDHVAHSYDSEFIFSNIGKLQRKRVYHFLEKILPKNKSVEILEINCGTGEDALYLAKKGHKVVATDESGVMIEKAIEKCLTENDRVKSVSFEVCSFDKLTDKYPAKKLTLSFPTSED